MTTLDDFKNALILINSDGESIYDEFVNVVGAADAAQFLNVVGAADAAHFVDVVGAEDAADFVSDSEIGGEVAGYFVYHAGWTPAADFMKKVGVEDAKDFVENVGGERAGTFVKIFEQADDFVIKLEEPNRIASILSAAVMEGDISNFTFEELSNLILYERETAIDERDTARDERDTAIYERDTARDERDTARDERDTAIAEANDLLHVAEKNNVGFDIANKDLTGKNLSGLKIKSLEGCGYDPSNPPNFSRCDLTGCDMTKLIQLKKWEELLNTNVDDAVDAIKADEPTFTVIKVEEGSVVTEDFLLNRVRVWYNAAGLVSRVPVVG